MGFSHQSHHHQPLKVHLGQPLLHTLPVRARSVFVKSTLGEAEHEETGLQGCF